MPFQNKENQNFMGIIQGVSSIGKLKILLENDAISEFDIKEIFDKHVLRGEHVTRLLIKPDLSKLHR